MRSGNPSNPFSPAATVLDGARSYTRQSAGAHPVPKTYEEYYELKRKLGAEFEVFIYEWYKAQGSTLHHLDGKLEQYRGSVT